MENRSNLWTTIETISNHQESETPIPDSVQSALYNDQNQNLFMPTTSNHQTPNNLFGSKTNGSFKFPIGCELYEALGPSFYKQKNSFDWETVTPETLKVNEMRQETSSSGLLTQIPGSENLLEAVVASICCSNSNDKRSTSFGQPMKSLSRVQPPTSDLLTSGSNCYSFERLERSREQARVGKKRAKPRPRDRQLIQDRIKELRQIVPNGSKCSIDSLLERTIKHMFFMQCITKHANKIDNCAKFKLLGKETSIQRPYGHEQGSSWAMEVGNNLKLCPIIVENIGIDGQMLVEMMCDENVHFLEITEAIRSLGLTILKGITDTYGDKTWMCFVVEGENNRCMHRVDLLWSLIQILESKTNTSS